MMFETRRHRMRRERLEAGFLPVWRDLLSARVRHWGRLSPDEQVRLEGLALDLIARKRWEAAKGFEITDEMMVMVAAQAALIILGLPDDSYRHVSSIVMHPTTMVLTGQRQHAPGVMSDAPLPILGQAVYNGPVIIAWDTVVDEARHPGQGSNVVFHEFAHKLDMLDGVVDGTPPLADRDLLDRWVEVCTRVYEQVSHGRGGASLRSYAGVNPGEFFAVATEAFFDDPTGLRRDHADLYDVLAAFYRQDPASRER